MAAVLTIPARFNGPPASGHGGYTCGVVAARADGEVAVSLRRPPPLETPFDVDPGEDGGITVRVGDAVVATASPTEVDVTPPPMPEPAPAPSGEFVFGELREHPFPTCFACGPARAPDDGLRIFATPVPGSPGMVAARWTPHGSLGNGELAPEFVWAALDCPTGHACTVATPVVLARLAVRQLRPVRIGAPHVVAAWRESRDGRKLHAAGCLYDAADGTPVAVSQALWIELRDPGAVGARS